MLANLSGRDGTSLKIRTSFAPASISALAVVLALMAPASQAGADERQPLRFCADPTNLPFSSDNATTPGFYLEIAQALGKALDRPVVYDWYKSYFGKRTVRVTLLGKQCDAMIGLTPSADFMGPAVIFSKPIVKEGYALVTAKGRKISGIGDLKQLRVAVQYQTTPQNLLAQRDEIEKVTVLSPEEGMKALDQGKVDVAFVWGPVAGWLNKTEYGGEHTNTGVIIGADQGYPEIYVLEGYSRDIEWHADVTFAERPARASVLRPVALPPVGGDTIWTSTCFAYDALSSSMQRFVDGLHARHDSSALNNRDKDLPIIETVHPVVIDHPWTGERSIFVNPMFTKNIVELEPEESARVLEVLYRAVQLPSHQVRWKWRPDAVAMWDNFATQQHRSAYEQRRPSR